MRIINLACNNLLSLPREIGALAELRVLNLSNNYLTHLPATVANLSKLSALWLSDVQKKPLMALHSARDDRSSSQVLTCALFPQVGPIFGPLNPAVATAVAAAAAAIIPQHATSIQNQASNAITALQQQQQQQASIDLSAPIDLSTRRLSATLANPLQYNANAQLAANTVVGVNKNAKNRNDLTDEDDAALDFLQSSNSLSAAATSGLLPNSNHLQRSQPKLQL